MLLRCASWLPQAVAALLIAIYSGPAAATELIASPFTVDGKGVVWIGRQLLTTIALPPAPRQTKVARLRVHGHRVLHLIVSGKAEWAQEVVVEVGRPYRLLFAGRTGPQGIDGEWQQRLRVSSDGVFSFQQRPEIHRCDGQPASLFQRRYDFESGRFRPVPRTDTFGTAGPEASAGKPVLATLRATRQVPSELAGQNARRKHPLNTFVLRTASTQAGDERKAANLAAPHEAEDGRPESAWFENVDGDGIGEFLLAERGPSPYALRALRIIPGDADSREMFAANNRLKSAILRLSPQQRYRIVFPIDPLHDDGTIDQPYWIVLPKPVATRCAVLTIEAIYPGQPRTPRTQARTAISELRFLTELDFLGLPRAFEDLTSDDYQRRQLAVALLARQGPPIVGQLAQQLPGAAPTAIDALTTVLARIGGRQAAKAIARARPRMRNKEQWQHALNALATIGAAAAPHLVSIIRSSQRGRISPEVRAAAAKTLGQIGGPSVTQSLIDALGRGPRRLRAALVQTLVRVRPPPQMEALLSEARSPDISATRIADIVYALSRLSLPKELQSQVGELLPSLWSNHDSFEVHYRLIGLSQHTPAAQRLQLLTYAAKSANPVLRWRAVEALADLTPTSQHARRLARTALGDPDPRVRRAAVAAVARSPDASPQVVRLVVKRMREDPWPFVARAAARALSRPCQELAAPALNKAIDVRPKSVALAALQTLAGCWPQRFVDHLLDIAADQRRHDDLRVAALALLPKQLAPAYSERLVRLFVHIRLSPTAPAELAAAAADALGRLPTTEASQALVEALALDTRETLRAASAHALGRRCNRAATQALQRALKDTSTLVRSAAHASLDDCKDMLLHSPPALMLH